MTGSLFIYIIALVTKYYKMLIEIVDRNNELKVNKVTQEEPNARMN